MPINFNGSLSNGIILKIEKGWIYLLLLFILKIANDE